MTNDQLCRLVEAVAVHRDRRAFASLFQYFAPRLKSYGMKRGVEAATAEELVQETMLTVWRKAATFDATRATATTWIFTIVRNKRVDMLRRAGYPEVDLGEASSIAALEPAADDSLTLVQAGSALRAAMRTLPREQFEVLEKAYLEDKSHRVIAKEMSLPLGTVKSRIRLALARLRLTLPE